MSDVAPVPRLSDGGTPDEIAAAVACWCWWEANHAECPANRIPTAAELAAWLPECPADARAEAAELLAPLFDDRPAAWELLTTDGAPSLFGMVQVDRAEPGAMLMPDAAGGFVPVVGRCLRSVHALWRMLPEPRPRHPLAPLVGCWQMLAPVTVEPDRRADRRIMPALRVVGPSVERQRGARMLSFGGLLDGRPARAELTLWPEPKRHRVPLLEIVERTGLPFRSRGRGAPLEARLLVRGGLLMIRPEDRGRQTVRVAVTVRELTGALWPAGADGRRHDRQHWPKLLDALYRARDWTVPDAGGGRWFPMALRRLPTGADCEIPAPDDLIVLDLAPPPGAVAGPSVDLPWLDRQGAVSGPAWFAYIAARSLIWAPGTTRRPGPGRRWGWSRNPDDYPVLTLADLRRLAFGDRDDATYRRTRAAIVAPWESLPDVRLLPDETDPATGARGYRLLPGEGGPAPAE